MTTDTLSSSTIPALPALKNAGLANSRVPFHKLVDIEIRKTVNSRGGFWFAIFIAVGLVALLLGQIFGGGEADQTVAQYYSSGATYLGVFLPIVALLLVSTEWSQRTAMTTLAQQPRRVELIISKLTASLVIGVAACAQMILLVLALGFVAANDSADAMSLDAQVVGQSILMVLLATASGFAFGAAFLKSAPAIVGYLLIPAVVAVLGTIGAIVDAVKWIDIGASSTAAVDHVMTSSEWKYFLVSSIAWIVVPLAVGWWRVMRDEVG